MEDLTAPDASCYANVSANAFTSVELQQMELRICFALRFRLQHLTPCLNSHELIHARNQHTHAINNPMLQHMIKYLLVLSRLPTALIHVDPTITATGVVYLARATLWEASHGTPRPPGSLPEGLPSCTTANAQQFKQVVIALLREHHRAGDSSIRYSAGGRSNPFHIFSRQMNMRVSLVAPLTETNPILSNVM